MVVPSTSKPSIAIMCINQMPPPPIATEPASSQPARRPADRQRTGVCRTGQAE